MFIGLKRSLGFTLLRGILLMCMKSLLNPGGRFVPNGKQNRTCSALFMVCTALCLPLKSRSAEPSFGLQLIAEEFTAPIAVASLDADSGRLLVADQAGLIYLIDGDKPRRAFLDIRDRLSGFNQGMDERGIVGLTLHPKFADNGRFFVAYSAPLRDVAPADWNHTMRLSEFRVRPQHPEIVITGSERVILEIDQPGWNHNSGRLAFGPDGYLYWSTGDGSAPNDIGKGHAPQGNGQHLFTLLGKMLRLDIDQGSPYGIPEDNPFADGEQGYPEIYAFGLRNPWGFSFDRGGNHDLILSDVGQDNWEEINIIKKGGNYGWRVREGFGPFIPPVKRGKSLRDTPGLVFPTSSPDGKPFVDPVLVYRTSRRMGEHPGEYGVSITGGYVYRGKAITELYGQYIFADWSKSMAFGNGILLVAKPLPDGSQNGKWRAEPLPFKGSANGRVLGFIWSLGEDADGELYVMTNGANLVRGTRGKVYKLVPM
ncbi:MAG: Quinoprotein glucose dehydrogenase B [Verrucomicrobia subdivision 3 bacterium]|nr:Quinoprotein glucose dehydrogenase B [Limisphaerales bacterium]MCS1417842.1 Quinoprotein glucose dehydrogenase B [Limisphaerales bacterium]